MSEEPANTCGTCKHWKSPSERTDFRSAVIFGGSWPSGLSDKEAKVYRKEQARLADEMDKSMGECRGIPFCPDPEQATTPLASISDASQYSAWLWTGPDFYCALWAAKEPS